MTDNVILPPDPGRAHQYDVANWIPSKTLLPDGEVVSYTPVQNINALVPEPFDQIIGNYTGTDLTQCLYYSKGVLVATVNITYISIGSPSESYFKSATRID